MTLPETIGRYPVDAELGRGGMGVVYRARDPRLDRPVAIKVLSESLASDAVQLSRFVREAKLLARFNHPNIAAIYGFDETADGGKFLVLELIEGESLAARLARSRLATKEALVICQQVAAALVAAHSRGIVHRDLKPHNVLINLEGVVKVVDFGLAKSVHSPFAGEPAEAGETITVATTEVPTYESADVSFQTQAGTIMGTPSYMSPEQIRGRDVDQRSDLFAFGCLLFECLTGARAFRGETLSDLIAATLQSQPNWDAVVDVPEGIRRLLRSCLEKNADERLTDAASAHAAIDAALGTPTSVRVERERVGETPHNLPRSLSSFVGRQHELEQVTELFGETRLLTLTGAGGSGKTRLALQVARDILPEFTDGAWLVDLSAIMDPERIDATFMAALKLREDGKHSSRETILEGLATKECVVILDNCEHLSAPCADLVEQVLERCPNVKVMVTSREALSIAGETLFLVPSLSVYSAVENATAAALETSESGQLFVERARAAKPGFRLSDDNAPHIARICERLDGLPLALELAAARVRSMTPEEIAAKLSESFRLLTGGRRTALPRQQTMRAAFDWSFRLLSDVEQLLFARLAVFAGGFSLEAAESVCGELPSAASPDEPCFGECEVIDVLTALVEKSLVTYSETQDGHSRYRLLETGRQYGLEELLRRGGQDELRRRHLAFFTRLATEAEPHLVGHGQQEWLVKLQAERGNIGAALEWCSSNAANAATSDRRDDPDGALPAGEAAAQLIGPIWRFWTVLGNFASGRQLTEAALSLKAPPSVSRVKLLTGAGVLLRYQADYVAAESRLEEALAMAGEIDDRDGVAQALSSLAMVKLFSRRYSIEEVEPILDECLKLYRELGDRRGIANALNTIGWIAQRRGDIEKARELHDETLATRESLGDQHGVATALSSLGLMELDQGDYAAATGHFERSLDIFRQLNARGGVSWVLGNLGLLRFREGDSESARRTLEESLGFRRELRDHVGVGINLADLTTVLARLNEGAETTATLTECVELAGKLGPVPVGILCLEAAGDVALSRAQDELAAQLYGLAWTLRKTETSLVESLRRQQSATPEAARDRLGTAEFDRAWESGTELSFETGLSLVERQLIA